MRLLDRVRNAWSVRGFLINSLPKSGTHLLEKVVSSFEGVRSANIHFGRSRPLYGHLASQCAQPVLPLGIGTPRYVPCAAVRATLRRIGRGRYATAHVPFSKAWAELLAALGMKAILVLRDPRDVVVSHAFYAAATPSHPLFESFQSLSVSERIMASIVGVKPPWAGERRLLGIGERCRNLIPWITHPLNYTTRFEKLVGPSGGGARDAQLEEIANVARHLGFRHQRRDRERIADDLFGGTATFRKGLIGAWREFFTAEHRRAFRDEAGDVLIELGYEKDNCW